MSVRRIAVLTLLAAWMLLAGAQGEVRAAEPAAPASPRKAPALQGPAASTPGKAAATTGKARLPGSGWWPTVSQADSEQAGASTIDLLDEDNRLEQGSEEGEAGSLVEREGAEGESEAVQGGPGQGVPLTPADRDALAEAEDDDGEPFPSSAGIEQQKAFWIKIFTFYDSDQGVLHDGRIALPVYESLDLTGLRYRDQMREVRLRKRALVMELRGLAEAMQAGTSLEAVQQALLAKLPADSTPEAIRELSENVRFQRGLADRFREGLIRSGALREHIRAILARHGVPEDLEFLPHVESSFNNRTLSKYGAAGIWQFTRGTGRIFMTLRYELDERLDPIIATESAARYLRMNYERLGTWPLAITAYNHGPQSLERIVARMGTRDMGRLIEGYDGRLFKFASKNFYASFLAARQVARNYEFYFGPLELAPTLAFETVELPWHLDPEQAANALGIPLDTLRDLNPAVRSPVWNGSKYIPPGYSLRIPAGHTPKRFLAALPADARHEQQKKTLYVRVSPGDTLYDIGRRHGLSWRAIAAANDISSVHRLRPGQKLILPWDGPTPPPALAAAAEAAAAVDSEPRARLVPEHVVERIPVERSPAPPATAPWTGGQPVAQADGLASEEFQELRVSRYDAERKIAEIVAAYGETMGIYADWAGVTVTEIRRINDQYSRSVLRPGEAYLVPLDAVAPATFEERRISFHRERETAFFAENSITEKVRVEAQRGQSPWALAQNNNVPMWLFYKENPQLLTQPLRAGMEVILPVVRAGSTASQ